LLSWSRVAVEHQRPPQAVGGAGVGGRAAGRQRPRTATVTLKSDRAPVVRSHPKTSNEVSVTLETVHARAAPVRGFATGTKCPPVPPDRVTVIRPVDTRTTDATP